MKKEEKKTKSKERKVIKTYKEAKEKLNDFDFNYLQDDLSTQGLKASYFYPKGALITEAINSLRGYQNTDVHTLAKHGWLQPEVVTFYKLAKAGEFDTIPDEEYYSLLKGVEGMSFLSRCVFLKIVNDFINDMDTLILNKDSKKCDLIEKHINDILGSNDTDMDISGILDFENRIFEKLFEKRYKNEQLIVEKGKDGKYKILDSVPFATFECE